MPRNGADMRRVHQICSLARLRIGNRLEEPARQATLCGALAERFLSYACEVMSRTIVKDVQSDGSAGAGTSKKDPWPALCCKAMYFEVRLDDVEEWSDGEPSDDETEQERKERTATSKGIERCKVDGVGMSL